MLRVVYTLVVGLVLSGCATTTTYYLGAQEAPGRVLPLSVQGSKSQTWQNLYFKVDYRLKRQGDQLVITGKISFADYPKINLAGLDDMTLTLYLLNNQGLVMKYLESAKLTGYTLEDEIPFRQEVSLPRGVTAISFGYEGKFWTEEGGHEYFWKQPERAP